MIRTAAAARGLARAAPRARRAAAPARALHIGQEAPDFVCPSTSGDIKFHEWLGDSYALLVSHPADFTPVCTTELAELARRKEEFASRGVKIIGLSCDRLKKHEKWVGDVVDVAGMEKGSDLGYPVLADDSREVAGLYDMIQEDLKDDAGLPLTVRSVFLIGPDKRCKLNLTYPSSTGREWSEVLRAIDSIQLAADHPVATPHGWTPGGDVVVRPDVTTARAKEMYGDDNVKVVKPYLRIIKDPSVK